MNEQRGAIQCQSGLTAREDLQFTDATPDGILQNFFFCCPFWDKRDHFLWLNNRCVHACVCACVLVCVVHIQHTFWEWITTTFEAFK